MKYSQSNLQIIKEQVLDNIDRLYKNKDFKTIEDIILYLKPLNFDDKKLKEYEKQYLLAIDKFLNSFSTSYIFWKDYIKGKEVESFEKWFLDETHKNFYLKL